jgi:hypothetical protein
MSRKALLHGAGLAIATVLLAIIAKAAPPLGATRPALRLVDAWDRPFDLSQVGGRPLLVIYEDQSSVRQNAPLKDELSRLARGDRYRSRIVLAAVADVSGYDFWPVRGFVKDAIRDESRKAGTSIYCDWSGEARRAFRAPPSTSTVILYDRESKVVFAHEGAMPAATRATLLDLLRGMAEL